MNRPSRLVTSRSTLVFALVLLSSVLAPPATAAEGEPSTCAPTRSFVVHLIPAAVLEPAASPDAFDADRLEGAGQAVVRAGRGGARVRFATGDRDYLLSFSVSCSQDPETVDIRALELSLLPDSGRGLAGEDLVATNFEMPVGEPVTVSSLSGDTPLTLVLQAR